VRVFISLLLTFHFRMPGSQWSSRSSSRAGSNPGSGTVTRVSSADSVVEISSTEVSRTSSASSLRRALTRSRSGSSVDSVPFPRYSPLERGGVFKPAQAPIESRRTPNGYHIFNCYDPCAPAFSPVMPYDPTLDEGTPSGQVSRTASAEQLKSSRAPSRLSRVSSAESEILSRVSSAGLSRVSSAGSVDLALPPVAFEDTSKASSAGVSRRSSAGVPVPLPDTIPPLRTAKLRRGIPKMQCGTVARRTRSHEEKMRQRGGDFMASVSDDALSRTGSADAVKLGPEGVLLSNAAKKIESLALSRSRQHE
jgi:hypothetical protein